MSPTATACLTLEAFQRLAERTADQAEVRRWAAHLAGCQGCAATTRTLRAESIVVDAVVDLLGPWEPLLAAIRVSLAASTTSTVSTLRAPTHVPSPVAAVQSSAPTDATFVTLGRALANRQQAPVGPYDRTFVDNPARTGGPTAAHSELPGRAIVAEPTLRLSQPGLGPPQGPDEIGRIGPYRVIEKLGAGAVGIVYLAEDVLLKRMVALKLMRPEDTGDEMARLRFVREGRSAAALEHENIVAVYQVGEENGIPFLAMQLLQGETLDDRLKREVRIPIVEAVRIAKEIATGLAAAHDRGLIHRDIKPANIWLEAGKGRVKILDFGLARPAGDDTQLTQTGAVVGTPAYMSPEQARGAKVDHRTDLYSLGCVIYKMCAGVTPLAAEDTMAMLVALATDNPRPLTALNPNVPPPLAGLVNRLLVKHPDARAASAHDVVTVLNTLEGLLPKLMHELTPEGWTEASRSGGGANPLVQVILWTILASGLAVIAAYFAAPNDFSRIVAQVQQLVRKR